MQVFSNTPQLYTITQKFFFFNFFHLKSQNTYLCALGMFSHLGQDLRIAKGTTFALHSFKKQPQTCCNFKRKRNKKKMLIKILLLTYPGGHTLKTGLVVLNATEPLFFGILLTACSSWVPNQKINTSFFSEPDHRISYQIQTPKNLP